MLPRIIYSIKPSPYFFRFSSFPFKLNTNYFSYFLGNQLDLFRFNGNVRFGTVDLLIRSGADVNKGKNAKFQELFLHDTLWDDEWTPLIVASKYGRLGVVDLLIRSGADINKGKNGTTPLLIAVQNRQMKVVELLIHSGADINTVTEYGTPLHIASELQCHDIVDLLIRSGAKT